jgi:hypothetical protein
LPAKIFSSTVSPAISANDRTMTRAVRYHRPSLLRLGQFSKQGTATLLQ